MENMENGLNERTEDISGASAQKLDASEYDFLRKYIDYVKISAELGEPWESLLTFSAYVEQEIQHFSVPTELGKRIRTERKKLGLPSAGFAVKCGITRNTLSVIEHGKRPPTLKTLIQIADVLGMTLDSLIGRTVSSEQRDRIVEAQNNYGLRFHPEYRRQARLKREERKKSQMQNTNA